MKNLLAVLDLRGSSLGRCATLACATLFACAVAPGSSGVHVDGSPADASTTADVGAPGTTGSRDAYADGAPVDASATADGGAPGPEVTWPFPEGTLAREGTDDFQDAPQYLIFRKSPTEGPDPAQRERCVGLFPALSAHPFIGNRGTCVIFNLEILNAIPGGAARRTVMEQAFAEIPRIVGASASPNGTRRTGVEVLVDIVAADLDDTATYLHDMLVAARTARVPVLIGLDGINWLEWYFANVPQARDLENVEWTGYEASTAAQVGWRNWGSQFRIETPVPALTSRVYRAAIHRAYAKLMPIIRSFVASLPPEDQSLFAGVVMGTELSVGVNYYHYPNGNALLGQPARCDPGLPYAEGCPRGEGACAMYNHTCPPSFGTGQLSGGVAQLGYRAALDLGALKPGQPMTRMVLDRIVTDYLGHLHHMLLVEFGLPSHKIHSHTGGTFGGTMGVHTLGTSRIGAAIPGWSMYFSDASNPAGALGAFLEAPENSALPWSSAEWLPHAPDDLDSDWNAAYERNLGYRNNRLLSVANWEGVSPNPTAMGGAGRALTNPANCALGPRTFLGQADLPSGTMLHFARSAPGTASYFNASSTNAVGTGGTLAMIDAVNADVTATQSISLDGREGPMFVQLVTDGCPGDGVARRVLSPITRVVAVRGTGVPPSPPYLFRHASGEHVTLSWEIPAGTMATYLNIGTDPSFARSDSINQDVSRSQLFTWSGFAVGTRFFARIVTDGDFGRRISNVIEIQR